MHIGLVTDGLPAMPLDELLPTAAGLGIALLPAFRCLDDLRAHRLERVLRDWSAPSTPVHAVYPSTRHLSPKIAAFRDLSLEMFQTDSVMADA